MAYELAVLTRRTENRTVAESTQIAAVPSHTDVVYEFILNQKLITAAAALLLAVVASAFVGKPGLWWRGIAFNYMFAMAAAFFLVAPWAQPMPSLPDALGGLFLEFTVLCLFYILFAELYATARSVSRVDIHRLLLGSLTLQLLCAWPVVTSEGFGIFSDGSRIEYLYSGALAKYFTYAGVLIAAAQAALLAQRITLSGGLGWLGLNVMLVTVTLSVLAGSKGGAFIWILSILALVDYRRARISPFAVAGGMLVVATALTVSSVIISGFLGITVQDFADLALNRFFLNNDARALAFDQRGVSAANASLVTESFRSLAGLFGSPPRNPPLGLALYEELLGLETGNGANSSLVALIVYYSAPGYAAVPAMIAACGAVGLALFFDVVRQTMRTAGSRVIVLAFAVLALQQYSQDFLAFQVVMPLMAVAIVFLWIYDFWHFTRNRGPLHISAGAAAD